MSSSKATPVQYKGKMSAKRSLVDIEKDIDAKRTKIRDAKKELKPRNSFDADYWDRAAFLVMQQKDTSTLLLEKLLTQFLEDGEGSEEEFHQTERAIEIRQVLQACEVEYQLCKKQSHRLRTEGEAERSKRRVFMNLFTSSRLGLNIAKSVAGAREGNKQWNFRLAIVKEYNLTDSTSKATNKRWDVVSGRFKSEGSMTASHIFAWKHGQEMMSALFGEESKDEMFSPRNGLLLPNDIEAKFDSGLFAIVPNVDLKSQAQVALWGVSHPREYKFRILDWKHPSVDDVAVDGDPDLTWRDLDGRKLQFRSNFRPRARFLYFHYCVQVLRIAWYRGKEETLALLKDEVGTSAWGTKGRYIAETHLRAFVDELGHEFEFLLEGADRDESRNAVGMEDLLISAAAGQIKDGGSEEDDDTE